MNDRVYKGRTLATVDNWLDNATQELTKANIPSARLDAELLLGYMLGVSRTWLIAHGDDSLHATALHHKGSTRRGSLIEHGDELLLKRLKRVPIAYITGHKEFYGRDFVVTKDTLIPRPETEALVDIAKKHKFSGRLLDVGTGSGSLGLTLALETDSKLTVSDVSEATLDVARKNAKILGVKPVHFVSSDLLQHWLEHEAPKPFDVIASNLPYVDPAWKDTSPELAHEPYTALYAADGGLALIKKLIDQAPRLLVTDGYLLLEADPTQHDAIATYATNFHEVERQDYALLLQKI